MTKRNCVLSIGALTLAALLPMAAPAIAGDVPAPILADHSRVWVGGHYETREQRVLVPAETRQQWIAPRYEDYVVPAVTKRVFVPAVRERVRLPDVTERVWIPEETERYWQNGYWDLRGYHASHWADRVVRRGHWKERFVREGGFEEREVQPARWETRIVTPARHEPRLVEAGRFETVVVRPERYEVTRTKVWVPGHWE